MVTMPVEEVYEIRVRPTKDLSPAAQAEVLRKLSDKPKEFLAGYRGFSSITYVRASPLHVKSVDPIEGEFHNLFAKLMANYKNKSTPLPPNEVGA